MKQSTFCVVSPIRDNGALFHVIETARKRLTEVGISFTAPKMGNHTTFVPPFRATEVEMRWLTAGLEFVPAFYSDIGNLQMIQGTTMDFFRGETDALILRLTINKTIRDLVERFRAVIPKHTEWVYKPESYLANFHATIAEGQGLAHAVESLGALEPPKKGLKLFEGVAVEVHARLEPPQLFEKTSGGWQPWRL